MKREYRITMLLACAVALLQGEAASQVTSFKLSDFKYRTPLYKSLQLDVNLEETMGTQTGSYTPKRNQFSYNFNGFLDQIKTIATDTRQHESQVTGFLQTSSNSAKEAGVKKSQSYLNPGLGYRFSERRFKANYFIEYGGGVNGSASMNKDKATEMRSKREAEVYVRGNIGIGRGRLEYVQDAQTALYILNDLYKEGIITGTVSAALADQLAHLITTMKRTRVIDQRRRTIYQLTTIDSFLVASGILRNCNSKTSAIINDNLFYGFTNDLSGREYTYSRSWEDLNFDFTREEYDEGEGQDFGMMPFLEPISDQKFRSHGTILYARLQPTLFRRSYKEKIGDSVVNTPGMPNSYGTIVPEFSIGYEKHEAVSLQWQKIMRVDLGFRPEFGTSYRANIISLTPSYTMGYYPNSKTMVEGTGQVRVNYTKYRDASEATLSMIPDVTLHTGYFISHQTVLRGYFSLSYYSSNGVESSGIFAQNIRFALRHYFY